MTRRGWVFFFAETLVCAAFCFGSAYPAHAETRLLSQLDENATLSEGTGGTNGYAAQSFTVVSAEVVESVAVAESYGASIEIANGTSAVCTGVTQTAITGGMRYVFNSPCSLAAGTYYLVGGVNGIGVYSLGVSTANPYSGGQAGNANLNGASFSAVAGDDWTFVLCGTTDCSLARVAAIDWSALSLPLVYSSSSQALATSSALWSSLSLASSTQNCNSGNVFSDALCGAGVFLFVPNTGVVDALVNLASTTIPSKFPFSWLYGVSSVVAAFPAASTTPNLFSITYNFAGSEMSSTSPLSLPQILPAATVFASTTIETYLSPAQWAFFQTLIAAAIWLAFGADVFFTVRNAMHK